MNKPKHLNVAQQAKLAKKLIELFGLPALIRYLKIEWSVEQGLIIETQHYPDSNTPGLGKAEGEQS